MGLDVCMHLLSVSVFVVFLHVFVDFFTRFIVISLMLSWQFVWFSCDIHGNAYSAIYTGNFVICG